MYRGFTCHKSAIFFYFVCFVTVDALEKLDYDPSISIFIITRNSITVDGTSSESPFLTLASFVRHFSWILTSRLEGAIFA